MEVVDREPGVREQFANRAGVPGVRVDHHNLHAVAELRAALGKPAAHRGGGAPVDLPEQALAACEVDEPGLPRIAARTQPPAGPRAQRGRPKRVSSSPSTGVGAGSPSSAWACATTARCTVGQDTVNVAATSAWQRPSSTAVASRVRSRDVVRARAGTSGTCSVKLCRGQAAVRQRHRRLRHCSSTAVPPTGRSRGRVSTHSLPAADTCRQSGHRAAPGSVVTSCTTRIPSGVSATRSTANPASPNRRLASPLRSSTARGSPLAAPKHSEDQGVTGRPSSGAPHGHCPVKIEGPSIDLTGAHLADGNGLALDLADAIIGGSLYLITDRSGRRLHVDGRVAINSAQVAGQVILRDATIISSTAPPSGGYTSRETHSSAISASRLSVGGKLTFEGDCRIVGRTDLPLATLGSLTAEPTCNLDAPGSTALDLTDAELGSRL
jgi:cytoskeletal protein CcmA (bactofilin family)